MPPPYDTAPGTTSTTRLWIGIGVIVLGLLSALDNLGFLHHGFFLQLWPLLLVALGLSKLKGSQPQRGLSGYVFIIAGLVLLVANFGGASLAEAIWPLFVVALGVLIVTKALRKHRNVPPQMASQEGFLSGTALFGGSKRRLSEVTFQGGDMTAIFGGFEVDLRQATASEQPMRMDVFILFGGGEFRVPQGWSVDMKATSIAGTLEDKTLHLPMEPGQCRPTLVLTGLALFGGLTVSN